MSTGDENVKLISTNKLCWDKYDLPPSGYAPEHAIVIGRKVMVLKQWFNDISKPNKSGLPAEGVWLDVLIGMNDEKKIS